MRAALFAIFVFFCVLVEIQCSSARRISCPTVRLKNGRVRYRNMSGFVQFQCNKSYLLAGEKYMKCIRGKWEGDVPVCVKNTCKKVKEPTNGFVYPSHRGAVLNFFCKAGYEIKGNPVAYCDGETWSGYLPSCIAASKNVSLNCTFEDEDLCGWSHDINHDFDWTRMKLKTPSGHIGTGPSHDHTLGKHGEGYYMYIEASSRNLNDTARLISPVYKKQDENTCLVFWYHMYGLEVGELRVYLKKVGDKWTSPMEDPIFVRSGNQGDRWRRSLINLGSVDDEFQIVMEGVRGGNYLSDIAIDDVSIFERCTEADVEETTSISSSMATDEGTYEYGSCSGRCNHRSDDSITCDCNDSCMLYNTCCPDYIAICILGDTGDVDFADPYNPSSEPSTDAEGYYTSGPSEELGNITKPPIATFVNDSKDVPLHLVIDSAEEKPLTTTITNIFITKIPAWTYRPPPKNATEPDLVKTTANVSRNKTTLIAKTTVKSQQETSVQKFKSPLTIPPRKLFTPRRFNYSINGNGFPRPSRNLTTLIRRVTMKPLPTWKYRKPTKPTYKENDLYKWTIHHGYERSTPFEEDETNTTSAALKALGVHVPQDDVKISAGGLVLLVVGVGLLFSGVVMAVCVLKKRQSCLRLRMRNGPYGDSQSDVRFLTSDEVLDFTLASPGD